MKVLQDQESIITDTEVFQWVQDNIVKYTQMKSDRSRLIFTSPEHQVPIPQNLMQLLVQLNAYLQRAPAATQSSESIEKFLLEIRKFTLAPGEILMLINLRPTSLVILVNVIEKCDKRFTKGQQDEILRIIETNLEEAPCPHDPDLNQGDETQEFDDGDGDGDNQDHDMVGEDDSVVDEPMNPEEIEEITVDQELLQEQYPARRNAAADGYDED